MFASLPHRYLIKNFRSCLIGRLDSSVGKLSHDMTKPTKWVCAQRRFRSAWASAQSDQSSLSAWRKLGSLTTHWAHSEHWSDWAHSHFVGFGMMRLKWFASRLAIYLCRAGSNCTGDKYPLTYRYGVGCHLPGCSGFTEYLFPGHLAENYAGCPTSQDSPPYNTHFMTC